MKITNDFKVSLVAAICLLALAVISRKVLQVQIDFVSLFAPVWMWSAYMLSRKGKKKSRICCNPFFWQLAIVLVTLAILAVYSV